MMAPDDLPRHKMIRRVVLRLGQRNETSLALWTKLATALAQIIGDSGFESLFFRSLHQIAAQHPWLAASSDARVTSIVHLSACLATRDNVESEDVSASLLIIFTDTLNLLIGELVTNRILHAAWGTLVVIDVPEQPK